MICYDLYRCSAAEAVSAYFAMLSSASDHKGKYAIKLLLQTFLRVVDCGRQRLPSPISVFFAEASAQFTRDTSRISLALKTFLESCTDVVQFAEIPLANSILSQTERDENMIWMIDLLRAGMLVRQKSGCNSRCSLFAALSGS